MTAAIIPTMAAAFSDRIELSENSMLGRKSRHSRPLEIGGLEPCRVLWDSVAALRYSNHT
ncbi:hypothetical protein [Hyphomicrobium sp. D-2]|uniref:hypothetical protein n=1 Tax=Hyphomicrobium sp. D-2 TaxID=3041621 RepID=UPI002457EE2B|nr:hypothetical protein [Hyphomicrobium sp. D-2]MDH4981069.1 hypothetical protein [Hyphomicrobium sp. D-2]